MVPETGKKMLLTTRKQVLWPWVKRPLMKEKVFLPEATQKRQGAVYKHFRLQRP